MSGTIGTPTYHSEPFTCAVPLARTCELFTITIRVQPGCSRVSSTLEYLTRAYIDP